MKEIPILYEDDEIFVVDKPSGLAVQGGQGISHSLDVELPKIVGQPIHLVHRLDKETCGLLIVAKNAKSATKWIHLIGQKDVKKEYEAICFGVPKINGKERVRGTILSNVKKGERELKAKTDFEVLSTWKENVDEMELVFSHLKLVLGTGRTHQIRIHLASASCPIAGDDRHGDFQKNKIARKLGIKKLQLCAKCLTLPINGKNLKLLAKTPTHFFLPNREES